MNYPSAHSWGPGWSISLFLNLSGVINCTGCHVFEPSFFWSACLSGTWLKFMYLCWSVCPPMQFNIRTLTALHVFMMSSVFRYLAHLSAFLFPYVSLMPSCCLCVESGTGCDRSLFSNVRSPREMMTCERVREGWLTSGWSRLIIPDVLMRTSLLSDAEPLLPTVRSEEDSRKRQESHSLKPFELFLVPQEFELALITVLLCRVLQYTISTTDLKQLVRLPNSHRCL